MAGEYGIGQGIVQGMQLANQGIMNAETIQASREQRRQNAEKTAAYLQTAQVQQDTSKQQLEMLQFKFDEMQKQKAKEDTFNAFNAYEETGDVKYLNLAKDKNPLLKQMLDNAGTVSMQGINEFSEEKLTSLGYQPGKFIKPIVITKNDGTQAIEDLTGTYVASGYLKEMRKDKLDDLVLRVKENQIKTEETNFPIVEAKAQFSTQILTELQKQVAEGKIN